MQNMSKKSKSVKLPAELIDALEKRKDKGPPGEVLLAIVKDYELLEAYAKHISSQDHVNHMIDVSGVMKQFISDTGAKIDQFIKSYDELKAMVLGLRMFFDKSKEWK